MPVQEQGGPGRAQQDLGWEPMPGSTGSPLPLKATPEVSAMWVQMRGSGESGFRGLLLPWTLLSLSQHHPRDSRLNIHKTLVSATTPHSVRLGLTA